MRHYITVTRTELLYGAETLKNQGLIEVGLLEKNERTILRNIWVGGNMKYGDKWIKTSNEKLYSSTGPITTVIRKRRPVVFGHLMRTE